MATTIVSFSQNTRSPQPPAYQLPVAAPFIPLTNFTGTFRSEPAAPVRATFPLSPTQSTQTTRTVPQAMVSPSRRSSGRVPLSSAPRLTSPQRSVDSTRYKTSLCRNFAEAGVCPYGDICIYAHGTSELRNVHENAAAVQSLGKLAEQLLLKKGPASFQALGPLRHRKQKNCAQTQAHPVDVSNSLTPAAAPEPSMRGGCCAPAMYYDLGLVSQSSSMGYLETSD